MIDISKGRYWNKGITLVDGCTPCSPGCDHCWSAAQAHRFKREGEPGHESGILTNYAGSFVDDAPYFNGDIIIYPERLSRFKTRKPKVFASWNDLFHEAVPVKFIIMAYEQMSLHDHNTYLILTKRHERMSAVLNGAVAHVFGPAGYPEHIYHGLTVCNQAEADAKIPIFLQAPGKKFLSIEPMLGPVDLKNFFWATLNGEIINQNQHDAHLHPIRAVLLGGETGAGARPMHPDWVRSVRDQCFAAGVLFFFKQWGEWISGDQTPMEKEKGASMYRRGCYYDWGNNLIALRAGKKDAGRLLDGRTHDELPWVIK